ncbi:MAG: 4-hydroxy-3-methylbut-2-enyl diphosphate reductase [Bacteroidaceae bacterium]|nr:4-hydroxy-3-methylbut-2-enyl diphosphate reductase [Bacteroidaceae bacterium]
MIRVEIDERSGFCFGVTTAIRKAEEELQKGAPLYCLGDIVHNGMECERLRALGLIAIDHEQFRQLRDVRVLLRAHGEPPETYEMAKAQGIELIDATCPVVLNIQKRIKQEYATPSAQPKQIIIYGQKGHAEVLGLVGQTEGNAIVIESIGEINRIDFTRDVYLYSQTTKSLDEFRLIVETIKQRIAPGVNFQYYDTICRQVSNRLDNIRRFAEAHDLIFFVCGKKSSNGKVLYQECLKANPNSYHVEGSHEIDVALIKDGQSIGICGATSTPKWLMEECKQAIFELKIDD